MFSKTLPRTFSKLLRNNTREEFNSNFQVREIEDGYWALCDKECREVIPCPPGHKNCQVANNCEKCWANTIQSSKFKGEN